MKFKKLMVAVAISTIALLAVGCSSDSGSGETATPPADQGAGTEVAGDTMMEGFAEQPILLTSAGQSADVEMIKVVLDREALSYTMDNMATADTLGENKTLVVAIGGSSKGLGAAGIDADQEIDRVTKLIDAAKENGMSVIALHTGGEARRGDLSDRFVEPVVSKADYTIVVKDGNKDNLFNTLAGKYSNGLYLIDGIADASAPLKAAFK